MEGHDSYHMNISVPRFSRAINIINNRNRKVLDLYAINFDFKNTNLGYQFYNINLQLQCVALSNYR